MSLLPPTVLGPLSECSACVRVRHQRVGARVTLRVNGSPVVSSGVPVGGGVAAWPDQTFPLGPGVALRPGDRITATQTRDGRTSPASVQPVVVQKRPETVGPLHFGSHVYACGQCLRVDGAVPGAAVTVQQGPLVLGSAPAPDGTARIALLGPVAAGRALVARQSACGTPGAPTPSPLPDAPPRPLPPPVLPGPLLAGQPGVTVSGVCEGARVTLLRDNVPSEQACFDLATLTFRAPAPTEGEQVSVLQEFPACGTASCAAAPVRVVPASRLPAPAVTGPLCAGATSLHLTGLVPGALLTVLADGTALGTAQAFRPAADLDVPPLPCGSRITVHQQLGGHTAESAPVPVGAPPPALPAPVVVAPLTACAARVRVRNVHPGALVLVFSTALDAPIGCRYVHTPQASVPVAPLLAAGDRIVALQVYCGLASARSLPVPVRPLGDVRPPQVRTPLGACLRPVVGGLVPGADTDVYVNGRWRGTAHAVGSTVPVELSGAALDLGDTVTARQRIASVVTEFGPPVQVAFGPVSVTTQHNDNRRTGAQLLEVALSPATVGPDHFGKLFSRAVDGHLYAQPLYVSDVAVPGHGRRNVVYAATMHNSVYAFDADDPGAAAPLWHASLGPSAPLPDPQIGPGGYRDIAVEVGIVSTPVIDLDRNVLYAVAFTKDGQGYHHSLHALDIGSGQEMLGGPVRIAATVPGGGDGSSGGRIAFTSHRQLQRAALALANGRIYAAFASYGDRSPYHGWVFGFDAGTLQQTGVYVTTPDTGLGGIWQAGQGPAVDDDGFLYAATGNGGFRPDGSDLGDSIVKLTPGLALADWFSPFNNAALNAADADLGSAGPLLIPGTRLLLSGGKESKFYLLDTRAMGHFHAGSDSQIVQSFSVVPPDAQTHHIHGGAVHWNFPGGPWVYVWPENAFLRAYRFAGGRLETTAVSTSTTTGPAGVPGGAPGMPGGILSLSAHGTDPATGLLWASHPWRADANNAVVEGVLRVYRATDLTQELWNSKMHPARDDVGSYAKFAAPTIANGKVYLGTFSGALHVYGLLTA
ncbi:hypothetical protein [Streptomyces sp. NPDC001404]|uniref:hypothetical protein n=1 Tax=Streptomyces sp. NPDC001404 TaxID=3364571 RepID=UPI0036B2753F